MVRKSLCAGLGAITLLAAKPALALVMVDLTIDYFPSTVPPNPIFQGTELAGTASFFSELINTAPSPITPPNPIDIGQVAVGGAFDIAFQPTDPCFGDGSCALAFSFGGTAGQFGAEAFLPSQAIQAGLAPILPIGTLSPQDPCRDSTYPGDPCRATGNIVAFDSGGPVDVGTWAVTMTAVPEPATLALFSVGLAGLGLMRRARRRPAD